MTTDRRAFTNAVMTGTSVLYSPWINVGEEPFRASLQVSWTGTPTGAFELQTSNDRVIQTEQERIVGAASNGTQGQPTVRGASSVAAFHVLSTDDFEAGKDGTDPAGSAGTIIFHSWPGHWVRIKYTNASGSGVLNGFVSV